MALMSYGDHLDAMDAVRKQAAVKPMARADAGAFLAGYLHPFALVRPVSVFLGKETDADGGFWLPGLQDFWPNPGRPVVPLAEVRRGEVGRVHYIMREVLAEATRRGELHLLTTKTGRARADLLYRCGLGRLA
jgi:hypothetical protein